MVHNALVLGGSASTTADKNFLRIAKDALDRNIKKLWENAEQGKWDEAKIITEMRSLCMSYYRRAGIGIRKDFFTHRHGRKSCQDNSKVIDILLLRLVKVGDRLFGADFKSEFALIAVGGYGRRELAPYSDIDIIFIGKKSPAKRGLKMIDFILYSLWDLGVQVGHAVRTIPQNLAIALKDQTVATALLESRYLAGDRLLYNNLRKRFLAEVIGRDASRFALAKLDERDNRHQRMGNTRYVLEPNIKEGKGALRDLHLMRWVALSFYHVKEVREFYGLGIFTEADNRAFDRAIDFFLSLRVCLHYLTARPSELLTFDMQMQLADRMGYRDSQELRAVERLMRSYFLHATDVAELTRILATDLREKIGKHQDKGEEQIGDYLMRGGRLHASEDNMFFDDPIKILEIFKLGLDEDLDFHPNVFRAIRKAFNEIHVLRDNLSAYDLFLQILTAEKGQERILRTLSESGFLGRFLLDFGKVQAQMQYDMYHVYTTDEHTIRAVGNINRIEQGQSVEAHPLASAEISKIKNRKVLYMATFLHDIAKGQKGDHSLLGAELALRLCPKFGFAEDECTLISWLVKYHLLMSNTAFKRNLDDNQTIADFVNIVQTKERLRLLLCLTVADITAVGPTTWNNWKAHLIRHLYHRANDYMGAHTEGAEALAKIVSSALAKQQLKARMSDFSDKQKDKFLKRAESSYYLSYTVDELLRHARFVAEAEAEKQLPATDIYHDKDNAALHLLIYIKDSERLMAKICGAIALCGFSIVDARINDFGNNTALYSFTLQNYEASDAFSENSIADLKSRLYVFLGGDIDGKAIVQSLTHAQFGGAIKRTDVFSVTPQVELSNTASVEYTMIEVKGRDRIGLLFVISDTLYHLNLNIRQARIATFGEQAHDVFYVQDSQGGKITDKKLQEDIRRSLLGTLQRGAVSYI